MKTALAGGTRTTLASGQGDLYDVAVDRHECLLAEREQRRCDDGADKRRYPPPLSPQRAARHGLAIDSTSVYWTTDDALAVRKLTRSNTG